MELPHTIRATECITELAAALAVAQGIMEGATKDSANPFFKSTYADLASIWDAIRKPLADNGLSVMQLPTAEGPRVTITTILAHKSGQWISSELTITAKEDTPQAVGSAITYARRYALQSVVGVAPEDDDGERAHGRQPQQHQTSTPSRPRTAPLQATQHNGRPVPPELTKIFERLEKDPTQFPAAVKFMEDAIVDRHGTEKGLKMYDHVADEFYGRFPKGTTNIAELKATILKLWEIVEQPAA